jgi:uroporphyrinogen-III decarboxylase
VIKHPVVDLDFAAAAKSELDKVDRNQAAFTCDLGFQPFQQLVAFMGFTETLCFMYEEPDAVKDLLNFMADWYVPLIEKILDHWKPDIVTMADDTAAQANPFFSVEMYRDIFKPIYRRITKPAIDRGVLVDFHNCGRCEPFVPEMVDLGVNYWNPCQLENDLVAIQKRFGNKIVITGGWDYSIKLSDTEETVRGYVRQYLDKYARNGGFIAAAFAGDFMGGPDAMAAWGPINNWLADEIYTYGEAIYR